MSNLKKIVILGTGGTIAGVAGSAVQTAGYRSGELSVAELAASVPGIEETACISAEQICNIGSEDMTPEIWLSLAKRVNELLNSDEVDGIVITHGTDTMEETAYFLNLTVKSCKPVVITGAMLPATAIGADGPLNLMNAVAAASSDTLEGMGVMCCMGQLLISARYVTKTNSFLCDAFNGRGTGIAGYVENRRVTLYQRPLRGCLSETPFDISGLGRLPSVEILYAYPGMDMRMAEYVLKSLKPAGIVIAGYGDGSMPEQLRELISRNSGSTVFVRASRTGDGIVIHNGEFNDDSFGSVASDNLNPQKARVLLMLALTLTDDPAEIRRMFQVF